MPDATSFVASSYTCYWVWILKLEKWIHPNYEHYTYKKCWMWNKVVIIGKRNRCGKSHLLLGIFNV